MVFLLLLFLEVIANKFIEGFANFLNHHCVAHLHLSFGIKFSLCLNTYQGIMCFINLFLIFVYFWLHWVFMVLHRLFSSCRERGLLCSCSAGFSLQRLPPWSAGCRRTDFSSCSAWASLPQGTCYPARPGIEPLSLVLAGRFLTTGPPEKTSLLLESLWIINIPLTTSLFHSGFILKSLPEHGISIWQLCSLSTFSLLSCGVLRQVHGQFNCYNFISTVYLFFQML